ncbi:uncharacterized protein [Lepisosteus oculatus]|nr:PREDICTED: uncharacterized protein LOC107075343 [Lepisosteus oculatus]
MKVAVILLYLYGASLSLPVFKSDSFSPWKGLNPTALPRKSPKAIRSDSKLPSFQKVLVVPLKMSTTQNVTGKPAFSVSTILFHHSKSLAFQPDKKNKPSVLSQASKLSVAAAEPEASPSTTIPVPQVFIMLPNIEGESVPETFNIPPVIVFDPISGPIKFTPHPIPPIFGESPSDPPVFKIPSIFPYGEIPEDIPIEPLRISVPSSNTP